MKLNRLSARRAATLRKAGRYLDGGGLCLQIARTGARSWILRFMLHGHAREMGLGAYPDVSLEQAREKARDAREQLRHGIDPIEARRGEKRKRASEAASAITFDEAAEQFIAAMSAGWRNAKHAQQWRNTLKTYASPVIGSLPVREISTEHAIQVLDKIWRAKPETASRVRGRIEAVLAWATVRGYRQGDNPARWHNHLDQHFPARTKVRAVRHHPALPYTKMGDFMQALRAREGVGARALEFVILTACRVSEAVGAKWSEIDFDSATWTVPAERMKAKRQHRVALSDAALAVLRKMQEMKHREFVFPGASLRKPLTIAAPLKVLRDMGRADLTVHGFRSTFRVWSAERTSFPRHVVEAALAHVIGDNAAEQAYLRTDLLDARRPLMQAWAAFCAAPLAEGVVIPIGKAAA
jgi:integrase